MADNTNVLDPVIDWAKEPELVQTQDASVMQPNYVSRGTEEQKKAELTEEARTMGIEDSDVDPTVSLRRFGRTVKKGFLYGDNAAVQMIYDFNRIDDAGEADPAWQSGLNKEWLDKNASRIPIENQWRYMQTRNLVEAQSMLNDSIENSKQQQLLNARSDVAPFSTFAARGIAGLVDVDLPFTLMSGGIGAGVKAGINATKIGRLLSSAAGGFVAGSGVQAGAYYANPDEDWTSVPVAGFMGMGLGIIGGAFKKSPYINEKVSEPANTKLQEVVQEYNDTLEEGIPQARQDMRQELHGDASDAWGSSEAQRAKDEQAAVSEAKPAGTARSPQAVKLEDLETDQPTADVELGRSSIGAGQIGNQTLSPATIENPRIVTMIQDARTFNTGTGHVDEFHGNYNQLRQRSDALARGVSRFQDIADRTGLVSDFSRLMRSGSSVAQRLAYEVFENASGKVRNNRSASMLQDHYQKQILGNFLPYHDAYTEFATSKGAGIWQRTWNSSIREDFDRQVVEELQARMYTFAGQTPPKSHVVDPAVKKAADAIDKTFAKEIDVGTGRPGEGSWTGFDTVKKQSGYFPQKWLGSKMTRLVASGTPKKAIIEAVTEAYRMQHPSMKPQDAEIWASAMVNRAMRNEDGLTTNLVSVLQGDGRNMLEQTLQANGVPQRQIDSLIDGLTSNMEEVGKPGQTKQRIGVDLRFIASNGIKLMDLVDTDINKIIGHRARRTAGQGALARKGIKSRQDWENIKEAIIQEQKLQGVTPPGTGIRERIDNALDAEYPITPEFMDDLFTYFSGSPIAGGLSPTYSRIRKLTNLSLLNQLGMTQLAEFGPMISAVGWKRFAEHAGEAFTARLHNKDSELVKELSHFNIFVPEERMFRDDLTFEYEKANPQANEYMQRFDNILNKAQRVQGFTSGFYEVRKIQQRIALTSGIDKIVSGMKSGADQFSPDRLRDMGFDPALMAKVQNYVNNGTITFQNGRVHKLNLDQWDPLDVENFSLAMNRQTNILVQKAMAGESSVLFHKDGFASLFFHLKSFPLLAMEKQAIRNMQMADQQALTTFVYGMVTAGAAYAARQAINFNEDNLTASRIATGAIGLSNMSGWIPMWSDPIAGLLGLDSLQMGGGKYGSNSIISLPASLTTMDRLAQAPSALVNAVNPFDDLKNGDIRAIQTIPLIGNLYGINALLNALKE